MVTLTKNAQKCWATVSKCLWRRLLYFLKNDVLNKHTQCLFVFYLSFFEMPQFYNYGLVWSARPFSRHHILLSCGKKKIHFTARVYQSAVFGFSSLRWVKNNVGGSGRQVKGEWILWCFVLTRVFHRDWSWFFFLAKALFCVQYAVHIV